MHTAPTGGSYKGGRGEGSAPATGMICSSNPGKYVCVSGKQSLVTLISAQCLRTLRVVPCALARGNNYRGAMGVGGFDRWGVGVGVRAGSREPSPFRSWPFGLRSLTHTILTDRVSLRTDSRPTAIAPLDHALRDSGTVPICAQSGPALPLHATAIHPATGTSFRCSRVLGVSSCMEPLPLVRLPECASA